jgi:hypothetical protein
MYPQFVEGYDIMVECEKYIKKISQLIVSSSLLMRMRVLLLRTSRLS